MDKDKIEKLKRDTRDWEENLIVFLETLPDYLPDEETRRRFIRHMDGSVRELMVKFSSDEYKKKLGDMYPFIADMIEQHLEFLSNVRRDLASKGGTGEN